MGLYKMVREFLIGRLGENGLFLEVGGEESVGPRHGIKGSLGEVAQSGSVAPAEV